MGQHGKKKNDNKRNRPNSTDPKHAAMAQATGTGSGSKVLPPAPSKDKMKDVSYATAAIGTGTASQPSSRPATPPPQDAAGQSSSPAAQLPPSHSETLAPDQHQVAQSDDRQGVPVGPQGSKRKRSAPEWDTGKSMYRVDEWESYMRPPPQVPHQFVVFALLKGLDLEMKDVLKAAMQQHGKIIVAADVFLVSQQIAFACFTRKQANDLMEKGLTCNDMQIPLQRRADYQPIIRKLTVANVDCTSPTGALAALLKYFSDFGHVLDVTPRYWKDTTFHNGVFHVTMDTRPAKGKAAPPEVDTLLGKTIYIDTPGYTRVCRLCQSAVHNRKDCKTWRALQQRPEALEAYYDRINREQLQVVRQLQQAGQQSKPASVKPAPASQPVACAGTAATHATNSTDVTTSKGKTPAEDSAAERGDDTEEVEEHIESVEEFEARLARQVDRALDHLMTFRLEANFIEHFNEEIFAYEQLHSQRASQAPGPYAVGARIEAAWRARWDPKMLDTVMSDVRSPAPSRPSTPSRPRNLRHGVNRPEYTLGSPDLVVSTPSSSTFTPTHPSSS